MTQFFTVNSASELLERDRRTVGRALRGIPAEHRDEQGRDQWRLPTIITALSASGRSDAASEALFDAIETAGKDVEDMLATLRACGDQTEVRRLLRSGIGACVGRLDRTMEAGADGLRPHEQQLLALVRDHLVGAVVGEVLELGDRQIAA